MPVTLIDAGPLVALVDLDDPYNAICAEAARLIHGAVLTVWPALAEAMYLLRRVPGAQDRLWDFIDCKSVNLARLDVDDFPRMRELIRKYHDLPMDLADAALVRVAERERIRRVFTIDRRDFELYRPYRLGRFQILP
ncbi:MAG: type II toxin-antitoxin system VapC family toxin [Candidatus Binataceae bacterium]